LRRLLPFILFVVVVCAFLWRPVFTGAALLPGDYLQGMLGDPAPAPQSVRQWNPLQFDAVAQFYPWRVFYAKWMSQGIIPLWNPHQFCGTPFQANGQSAVLYPLNLVFLLFNPITALTVYALLHLFLAACFTYLLMRSLGVGRVGGVISGIVYALSAFMVLWLELPTFVGAAVWLPAACWMAKLAVERKSLIHAMLSGAAVAMAFLAGHFQIAFYVGFATVLFWVWLLVGELKAVGFRGNWLRLVGYVVGFAVVAGTLAAPQILPTQELATNSHRVRETTSEGYDRFISNAFAPYRLVTIFSPNYYGSPSTNDYYLLGNIKGHPGGAADYMEYGAYAGVGSLVLACLGVALVRRRRYIGFFAGLGALALLTACGSAINLFFYYCLPGFSALGGPNRIVLLWGFAVAVLAGFGADGLLNEPSWREKSKLRVPSGLLWCVASLAVVALVKMITQSVAAGAAGDMPHLDVAGAEGIPLVWAELAAGLAVVFILGGLNRKVFAGLLIALVAADLFAFGINYNPTCDRAKVYPETELTRFLREKSGSARIAPISPSWSLFQVPKAILPPNAAMVYGLNDVQGYDSLFAKVYKNRIAAATGVIDPCPMENGNMVFAKQPMPGLADLGVKYQILAGPITGTTGPLRDVAVFNGAAYVYETPPTQSAPALPEYLSPNKMRFTGTGSSTGVLAYPGWVELADGKRRPVNTVEPKLAADLIALPDSQSRPAVFSFEPFSFRLGTFLMCLGVMLLSAVAVARFALRRRRSSDG